MMGEGVPTVPQHHGSGSNPLEQFVLLAKSARGAGAAELIKTALEAPGLYVFSEILDMPNIKDLATGEHSGYLELLNIFAYGTFRDYVGHTGLPPLTSGQRRKLQHLTIVRLSEREKCIPYSRLLTELQIDNLRELEDLIIDAIYAEIIQGKLDQAEGMLEVDTSIGRDIRPADMAVIAGTLESWCEACENVLTTLQNQVDRANGEKTAKIQRKADLEVEISMLKKNVKSLPPESDEMMTDSREALGVDKTPKKMSKKGMRTSGNRLFNK